MIRLAIVEYLGLDMAQPKGKEIKAQTVAYGPAAQHIDLACQYKNAADLLYDQFPSSTNQKPIREPIYYLYHHSVELAFKSFLYACNKPFRNTHRIDTLYEMCRKTGLVVRDDHRWEVHNCIDLLTVGNRYDFYRYPTERRHPASSLAWTRDVVNRVIDAVAERVQTGAPRHSSVRAFIGKPEFFPLNK